MRENRTRILLTWTTDCSIEKKQVIWHNMQLCRLFVLLLLLPGLQSVNGHVLKYGCLGGSIKMMEIVVNRGRDTFVSIYKTDENIMGLWRINNSIPAMINGYSKRVVLDRNGHVWIHSLIESDSANYTIKTEIENLQPKLDNVSLKVLVPPTKYCRPIIIPSGNNLFVRLDAVSIDECGEPPVSPYWLEHPGISVSREVIQLLPGNCNGIFHACIEGISLMCANISNLSEYCTVYNKSYTAPQTTSDSPSKPTSTILRTSSESSIIATHNVQFTIVCVLVATNLISILLLAIWIRRLYQRLKTSGLPKEEPAISEPDKTSKQASSLPKGETPNRKTEETTKEGEGDHLIQDSEVENSSGENSKGEGDHLIQDSEVENSSGENSKEQTKSQTNQKARRSIGPAIIANGPRTSGSI